MSSVVNPPIPACPKSQKLRTDPFFLDGSSSLSTAPSYSTWSVTCMVSCTVSCMVTCTVFCPFSLFINELSCMVSCTVTWSVSWYVSWSVTENNARSWRPWGSFSPLSTLHSPLGASPICAHLRNLRFIFFSLLCSLRSFAAIPSPILLSSMAEVARIEGINVEEV